jgi:transposase
MVRFSRMSIREAGMAAVAITRTELSAADLRREAARTRDANASRRMLAIALVLEGRPRGEAAAQCGMDRQTLRDWAHRYNAEGIAGLYDRRGRPGPKPRLSPAQEAEMERWVEAGPDPAEHGGLVRWRRTDLRDHIERRFGARLHERTVGKLLRRLRFRRLSVRPRHPESDPAAQEAFKKTRSAKLAGRLAAPGRRGKPPGGAESGCAGFALGAFDPIAGGVRAIASG